MGSRSILYACNGLYNRQRWQTLEICLDPAQCRHVKRGNQKKRGGIPEEKIAGYEITWHLKRRILLQR